MAAEQKLEIAQKEYDELVEEQKQFEEEAERDIDSHNVLILSPAPVVIGSINFSLT